MDLVRAGLGMSEVSIIFRVSCLQVAWERTYIRTKTVVMLSTTAAIDTTRDLFVLVSCASSYQWGKKTSSLRTVPLIVYRPMPFGQTLGAREGLATTLRPTAATPCNKHCG